jgi:hypothetical protein
MHYLGHWEGGGPGYSWALNGIQRSECHLGPGVLCGAHTVVLCCDGDFNWLGQVWGGGGFDSSLAVR